MGQETLFLWNNGPYFHKTNDPIFIKHLTLFLKKMWPYFYKKMTLFLWDNRVKIDPIFME